jgi:hypothetical protein
VKKQFEQILNARYLAKLGFGQDADEITDANLAGFLERVPDLERNLARYRQDGNRDLLAKLDETLDAAVRVGPVDEEEP